MNQNIITYLDLEKNFSWSETAVFNVLSDRRHEISGERFYTAAAFFAERLSGRGIWNSPVVIRAEHRLETLILFLGALLSGNYYVPLPEDLPEEKMKIILGQLHAKQVYTCDEVRYMEVFPSQDLLEELRRARARLPKDAILYMIFTSGSTGEPKGIAKSHGSMIAFLESYSKVFDFSEKDVLANQTPFYFDASAKDFYLMLKYRMDFHIVDGAMFFRPLELVRLLDERRVTVIQWVPSALAILSQLKALDKEIPHRLQKVFFVGEAFPVKQLAYWRRHLPDAMFVNLYGASEMAGVCCYFVVPESWEGEDIPLGRPLPGQQVYLMGERGLITEPGIAGELCVAGDTLAAGYLALGLIVSREEKGMDAFVSFLAEGMPEGRYYRTGDIAQYDEEGNLCFVSRRDFQIKHMGHRIELGEIERAAERIDGVERAAVVYQKGKICLYYQGSTEKRVIQDYLKERIQSYMMPHRIFIMESLPLNWNGKVDYMALDRV